MRYLGVDGGGTGCRVRLADGSGRVLAEAAAGPANIALDPEGALANILSAARAAGGADLSDIHAGLGLAGVNVSDRTDWLAARLPFARARIVTDAVTMVIGALAGGDGIVAAIGTGSVFAARRGGVVAQYGGWGHVLGDEGSGAVIGRMVLARSLRAHDGLVPMTPLLADVLARHGGPAAVAGFSLSARSADMGQEAPAVFASPDPAAAAILDEAAPGIIAYIERLQADGPLPVCWTGGLGPAWGDRIGVRWPRTLPQGSALDGALRLAQGG